jgi:hypothetical protein
MYAKIRFGGVGDLVQIAKFCGMAPCQILTMNKAANESDLVGKEITIKVELAALVREVGDYYVEKDGNIERVKSLLI